MSLQKYFDWIQFDSDKHKYTYLDQEFISVTKFFSNFSEFKKDEILEKYCGKRGLDKNMVSQEWKIKADVASARGSDIHFAIECYLKNHPYTLLTNSYKEFQYFLNFHNKMLSKGFELCDIELMVGDKTLHICGTLDYLVYNKKHNKYWIIDWKTNGKDIFNEKGYNKLKEPFNDLYSTNLNKYTLQLNMYKYIIERNIDIEIDKMLIVWLSNKNDNYKYFECPFINMEEKLEKL